MTDPAAQEDLREQSLPDLMRRLSNETTTLVRQEIELARAELTEKGKQAGIGAGFGAGAGAFALLMLAALGTAVGLALATAIPDWLAALVVALVYGAVAGILALQARQRLERAIPPQPEQTIETVKEDIEWAKTRSGSAAR